MELKGGSHIFSQYANTSVRQYATPFLF